jgi:hypothetical protein
VKRDSVCMPICRPIRRRPASKHRAVMTAREPQSGDLTVIVWSAAESTAVLQSREPTAVRHFCAASKTSLFRAMLVRVRERGEFAKVKSLRYGRVELRCRTPRLRIARQACFVRIARQNAEFCDVQAPTCRRSLDKSSELQPIAKLCHRFRRAQTSVLRSGVAVP